MRFVDNPLIASSVSVKDNAIKNILFRISAFALQFAFLKFSAFWAYRESDYTSFLMFAEGYIQQALFVKSRGVKRGTIVFVFILSYALAKMYDTLLWVLDSPGYVERSRLRSGDAVIPDLLQNPSYVTIISNPNADASRIDINEPLTSNLFKPGLNFSFPSGTYLHSSQAILPPKPLNPLPLGPGPRIYLDDQGFGVSFAPDLLDFLTGDGTPCSTAVAQDNTLLLWNCSVPLTGSLTLFRKLIGAPLVWWNDDRNQTAYLRPGSDDPWSTSGTEGGTAVMKQVFTLTKGNKRHTFLQTTWKTSMLTTGTFRDDEVRGLLRRVYAPGGGADAVALAEAYTQRCLETQKNGLNSTTMGSMSQDAERARIGWISTEFFNLSFDVNPTAKQESLLRIYNTTIELVRSEAIPKPVQSFFFCDKENVDYATGGKVMWNSCSTYLTPSPNSHFSGRIDTSSVAIITNVLGNAGNDTNAVALNATGMDWYLSHEPRIEQLLLSRAFLLGGDASTVNVLIRNNEPALSYLQIVLTLLPLALVLVAFLLVRIGDKNGFYRNSLFASLITTTHLDDRLKGKSVDDIRDPPDVVLRAPGKHTQICVEDKAFVLSS